MKLLSIKSSKHNENLLICVIRKKLSQFIDDSQATAMIQVGQTRIAALVL